MDVEGCAAWSQEQLSGRRVPGFFFLVSWSTKVSKYSMDRGKSKKGHNSKQMFSLSFFSFKWKVKIIDGKRWGIKITEQ